MSDASILAEFNSYLKRTFEFYATAHIEDRNAAHDGRGPLHFAPGSNKLYHTVHNILSDTCNREASFPAPTRAEFRVPFAEIFAALVADVKCGGKLSQIDPLTDFSSKSALFSSLKYINVSGSHLIKSENVVKDCNFISDFTAYFSRLLGDCKSYADPGMYGIATVYLSFIKISSWYIANSACNLGKFASNAASSIEIISTVCSLNEHGGTILAVARLAALSPTPLPVSGSKVHEIPKIPLPAIKHISPSKATSSSTLIPKIPLPANKVKAAVAPHTIAATADLPSYDEIAKKLADPSCGEIEESNGGEVAESDGIADPDCDMLDALMPDAY